MDREEVGGKARVDPMMVNLPDGCAEAGSRRGRGDSPFAKVQQEGFARISDHARSSVGQECPTYVGS